MNHTFENHPAAWRGAELLTREDWLHPLSDEELSEIEQYAERISKEESAFDPDSTETESPSCLPKLDARLKSIQHSLEHGSGAALIRGIPLDLLSDDSLSVDACKKLFWRIATQVGTPISQSATGERLFSVRDEGYQQNDPKARGPNTNKGLSFHTDRCDVISFLCLQPAKEGGENDLVSSVALYNQLHLERPDLVEVLTQNYLYQRHNVDQANPLPYTEQPIFSSCEGHFAANLLRVLIDRAYAMAETPDMTELQREALDFLESVASRQEMHVHFRQERGDLLFFNNFVTLHRRSEFVDFDDPQKKRHILRIWLSVPNSRPLDPRFAGNYGNTSAGAIRGGIHPKQ